MNIETRDGKTILTDARSDDVITRVLFFVVGIAFVAYALWHGIGLDKPVALLVAMAGLIAILLAIYLGRTTVVIDSQARELRISRASLIGRSQARYAFDDIADVVTESGDNGDVVTLVLHQGKRIGLSRMADIPEKARILCAGTRAALGFPDST